MNTHAIDQILASSNDTHIEPEMLNKIAGRPTYRVSQELKRMGVPIPTRVEALIAAVKWEPEVLHYIVRKLDKANEELALKDENIRRLLMTSSSASGSVPASAARPRISVKEATAELELADPFFVQQMIEAMSPEDQQQVGWDGSHTVYADTLQFIEQKMEGV